MAEGWRTQPGINATHTMDDDVCVIKYSHRWPKMLFKLTSVMLSYDVWTVTANGLKRDSSQLYGPATCLFLVL